MEAAPSSVAPRLSDEAARLPAILIADDDYSDLFFARHLVKRTGTEHLVITFADGSEVAAYLSRAWLKRGEGEPEPPRLLFLDLKMKGLGGFGFLEWLSQRPDLSAVHVVVLSGSDDPADVGRAKALGAKRYLAKHPSVATFTRIIAHVYGDRAIAWATRRSGGRTGASSRVPEDGGRLAIPLRST